MNTPVRIVGSYISPYVRKVLVVLRMKGIDYTIDPIVPFFGNDEFSRLSPVRRIPVLSDGAVDLCDSSVICQYLEDRRPEPALYPRDVADRARARWLEEFADTRMGDVFIWRLFNEVAINPAVWGKPTNKETVARTLAEDVPSVLDYLESQTPAEGFFFGEVSIADISVATFFRNAAFARLRIDAERWPKTAGLVGRTLALAPFVELTRWEELSMKCPPAAQRRTLAEAGAPISEDTFFTATPRRGLMPLAD